MADRRRRRGGVVLRSAPRSARVARGRLAAPPEFSRRLAVLCRAYGHFSVTDVVDGCRWRGSTLERQRTIDLGGAGVPPWDTRSRGGDVEQFDQEHSWLTRVRQELIAGGDTS